MDNIEITEYYNGIRVVTLQEPEESFWNGWAIPSLMEDEIIDATSKLIGDPLPIMLTNSSN